MSEKSTRAPRHDPEVFRANRSQLDPDDLLPYQNQWMVWSADGLTIVAHDEDLEQVAQQVRQAGIDWEDLVLEFIPPEEEIDSLLGGLWDLDAL
jgi:hypothetical protein